MLMDGIGSVRFDLLGPMSSTFSRRRCMDRVSTVYIRSLLIVLAGFAVVTGLTLPPALWHSLCGIGFSGVRCPSLA